MLVISLLFSFPAHLQVGQVGFWLSAWPDMSACYFTPSNPEWNFVFATAGEVNFRTALPLLLLIRLEGIKATSFTCLQVTLSLSAALSLSLHAACVCVCVG